MWLLVKAERGVEYLDCPESCALWKILSHYKILSFIQHTVSWKSHRRSRGCTGLRRIVRDLIPHPPIPFVDPCLTLLLSRHRVFRPIFYCKHGSGYGTVLVYYQQITGETNSEHERMVSPRGTRRSGLSLIISFIHPQEPITMRWWAPDIPQSPLPKSLHNIAILRVRRAPSMESQSLRT